MQPTPLSRFALPLIAFVVAVAGTSGLTLCAADSRVERKTERKASGRPAGKAKDAAGEAEKGKASLQVAVDAKPINREASERVSYAPIIKRTATSVVYVFSSKTVSAPELPPFMNDPRFRRFFDMPAPRDEGMAPDSRGGRPAPKGNGNREKEGGDAARRRRAPERTQQGLGSGVVVSADGYILTNNHVVEDADDVRVSIGSSNKRYEAKIVGRDPDSDLAVLKIEATGLSPATFGDSDQLQIGDSVLAIGNPFGVGQSVSRGIVSALSRGVGMGQFEDFIQTDAAINPGNSGGALIDTDGRVVGINSAILSRSGSFAGVGFAIPANLARSVAEQLVSRGRVERGFLGVSLQELDEELTTEFGTEKGALVADVVENGPAEKAGVKTGDVIRKVNAVEIRDGRHLTMTVSQLAPDTEVTLEVLRESKPVVLKAKLVRRDEDALARSDGRGGEPEKEVGVLNGVGVGEITPQMRNQLQIPSRVRGALITNIDADSPAARQGLREGDIILELDRKPVNNAGEAVKLSEEIKGPKVLVRIWREGRPSYLAIDESK